MSVPAIVESALGDAEVVERVSLGGDDELFVSAEHTLIYRADGLLSDESVEEYPHEADRVSVTEGRRKSKISLEYPIEGTSEFKVPSSVTDSVIHPVLAGVLSGNGVTDAGERVIQTFRFSELTVIITSKRLVKHIGGAVWDEDYEEFRYEDVTGLTFESGSVATQVVLEVDGRQQRIKAPNDQARELRQRLQQAIFAVHGVDSLDELHEKVGREDEPEATSPTVDFGEGVDPLSTDTEDADAEPAVVDDAAAVDASNTDAAGAGAGSAPSREPTDDEPSPSTDATTAPERDHDETTDSATSPAESGETALPDEVADVEPDVDAAVESFESSGFEPATASADEAVLERLDALEQAVEQQSAILERQQNTIEQLIEELRRGR